MVRGFYTAASGVVTQEKRLNVYANNITNVSTAGFKKDNLVAGTFGEHIAVRLNAYGSTNGTNLGPGVFMQTSAGEYTDHTQGAFMDTARPLDLAIQGNGYFIINNGEETALTRDGQFSLDAEGYLVLPGFGRVQGDGGDILIGTSDFMVDSSGDIYLLPVEEGEDYELIAAIDIAVPTGEMKKNNDGLFTAEQYVLADVAEDNDAKIYQGRVERSNVDAGEEMARIIESQRSFQSCSQIVKMYDELAEQMNTRLGRV